MFDVRCLQVMCLLIGSFVPRAISGEFTFSWHEAKGEGCANVFDGGPVICDSVDFGGETVWNILFGALDVTQPGALGASAKATGISLIFPLDDGPNIRVSFVTEYRGSSLPGGDNPGGAADGEFFSIIEFIMPQDELEWTYQLLIDDTAQFDGSTLIVFENLTQGETLFEITSPVFFNGTLFAGEGDLMRLTSTMWGEGSTPGGVRRYASELDMVLFIPEPATLTLLLFALPVLPRRRR